MLKLLTDPNKKGIWVLLIAIAILTFLTCLLGKTAHAEPIPETAAIPTTNTILNISDAMVWIATSLSPNRRNPVIRKPLWRKQLAWYIAEESEINRLPWSLVTAIIYRESSFDPQAKGDIDVEGNPRSLGLMQVGIGVRAQCQAKGWDLSKPHDQIKCGTWHFRNMADSRCDGNLKCAMSWYASGRTGKPDTKHLRAVVNDRFRLARKLDKTARPPHI